MRLDWNRDQEKYYQEHPFTSDWFELHQLSPYNKNAASEPPTRKKQQGGGRICPGWVNFFCPVPRVLGGLVAPFLWLIVGELNW